MACLQDAVALLRMDDLYIDSFEIKDGASALRPARMRNRHTRIPTQPMTQPVTQPVTQPNVGRTIQPPFLTNPNPLVPDQLAPPPCLRRCSQDPEWRAPVARDWPHRWQGRPHQVCDRERHAHAHRPRRQVRTRRWTPSRLCMADGRRTQC